MALERGYTMVQITYEGRELLRTLAYKYHKPMYEVIIDALRDALKKKDGEDAAAFAVAGKD